MIEIRVEPIRARSATRAEVPLPHAEAETGAEGRGFGAFLLKKRGPNWARTPTGTVVDRYGPAVPRRCGFSSNRPPKAAAWTGPCYRPAGSHSGEPGTGREALAESGAACLLFCDGRERLVQRGLDPRSVSLSRMRPARIRTRCTAACSMQGRETLELLHTILKAFISYQGLYRRETFCSLCRPARGAAHAVVHKDYSTRHSHPDQRVRRPSVFWNPRSTP